MKKFWFLIYILTITSVIVNAQKSSDYDGYLDSVIVNQVTDTFEKTRILWALDTKASDNFDGPHDQTGVYEIEGPPAPPGGIYGRFLITNYPTGIIPDVRNYTGFPYTGEHLLTLEVINMVAGNKLKINYPVGIEAIISDQLGGLIIPETILSGRDSIELNPALTKYNFKLRFTNFNPLTDIKENETIPSNIELYQNYPNPFNPETNISFSLNTKSEVTLKVYDILGKQVASLINGTLNAGFHNIKFNANKLTTGLYIYQLKTKNFVHSRKMMFVK
ncbi:MAG: T9SS type A sorting domain-containing protein [Ignavibacteriae bacterium]|nr:T9SS type A sorting domain-containing protein [Ignavibacteriota bacterium]